MLFSDLRDMVWLRGQYRDIMDSCWEAATAEYRPRGSGKEGGSGSSGGGRRFKVGCGAHGQEAAGGRRVGRGCRCHARLEQPSFLSNLAQPRSHTASLTHSAILVSPPCAPQPDLVIGTAITYGAVHCAEALGAACHVISTIPWRPTKVRADRVLVRHAAHVRCCYGAVPFR